MSKKIKIILSLLISFLLVITILIGGFFMIFPMKPDVEIKSADEIQRKHTESLREFAKEHPNAKLIVVSRDKITRQSGGIDLYYATDFFKALWNGELF